MKKIITTAIIAAAVGIFGLGQPASGAETPPVASGAPSDAPAYDPAVGRPGPDDLTWADVDEIAASPSSFEDTASQKSVVRPDAVAAGAGCTINTGNVYKRASGSGFPYGAVGGKPTTTCGSLMVSMTQSTTLYKTVWYGLQKVAGPFTSSNAGQVSITQKNVIRACDDLRETTFRMIVRNTGKFPTGSTGTASAFEESTEECGTK